MRAAVPILYWNQTVIAGVGDAPARALLPHEGDSVAAFCDFVAGLEPSVKAVRLLYHASGLEPVPAPCPRGSRKMIQKVLSSRFTAIADPLTAWAAHRVRSNAAGTTTLLYIEEEPRLSRLRSGLDERGITLEAAFPLLTVFEAGPLISPLHKPVIGLLHTDEAAAVFWRTSEGDRHAAFFDGQTTRDRAIRELVTGFSIFKTPPLFVVVNAGSAPIDLASLSQRPGLTLTVAEFLKQASSLSPEEPCNFLPPPRLFSVDRICRAAALVLFAAGFAVAATYALGVREVRANLALQQSKVRQLETSNARLRDNRQRIEAADAVLGEIAIARPVKRRFLETLGHARPISINVRAVTLNKATWSVTGIAHNAVGADKGSYQAFVENFGHNAGWSLGSGNKGAAPLGTEFVLNGTFP